MSVKDFIGCTPEQIKRILQEKRQAKEESERQARAANERKRQRLEDRRSVWRPEPGSLGEKLVQLAQEFGDIEFHASDLIMKAWLNYPQEFGLKHYETKHPASHKVMALLCGGRGLVNRGVLLRVRENVYVNNPEWGER